jgi:hypothetical protein
LLPLWIFYGYLVYFSRFGLLLYQLKSGNPASHLGSTGSWAHLRRKSML